MCTDTYDCLAVAGGMGEGHIPCAALHEMIRIVKPGIPPSYHHILKDRRRLFLIFYGMCLISNPMSPSDSASH